MIEYYFLFALGIIYCIIASIEDVKKTVVDNWVTFSFVIFALAYRAFYAIFEKNLGFFVFGVMGFLIFYLLGNLFYYSKAFGGADVKLLMGIGVILPYNSYVSLVWFSLGFILVLFIVTFIYTLLFSFTISVRNWQKFTDEFKESFGKHKILVISGIIIGAIFIIMLFYYKITGFLTLIAGIFCMLMPILYTYLKAVDQCLVRLTKPNKLIEGDWIMENIKVGNKLIRNTVHGLNTKDIEILRKARKSVYVKNGIPFIPAILIVVIIMVFFSLTSGPNWILYWFPF